MTIDIIGAPSPAALIAFSQSSGFGGVVQRVRDRARRGICLLDARIRTMAAEPERGAATVEYAIVVVAGAAFAGVLLAVIRSGFAKTLLTDLIKNALNVK